MWTRSELKSNAKLVLKRSYWECLVSLIIASVIASGASSLFAFLPVIGGLGSVAVNIFLSFPLAVGLSCFFIRVRFSPPVLKNLFYAFNEKRYMNIVAAMAWHYLFIFLWSLIPAIGVVIYMTHLISSNLSLFFFGGSFVFSSGNAVVVVLCAVIFIAGTIIVVMKSISYSMTPYILADNPNIGYARALKLSIQMTYGHKWDIFVLHLSFLGWVLLSVFTLFIGTLFLMPYILATNCELYMKLRDNAIRSGLCAPEELGLPRY